MEFYHALNRGVDKRDIFLTRADRERFVQGLYLFNDRNPVTNFYRIDDLANVRPPRSHREPLVYIHAWCLMGNHYHLLLSEFEEGGISKFLMKLNVGYTKYFNLRHERSGVLFQGKTKKVRIATDAHYLHILNYIHLNPLDYTSSKLWRDGKIISPTKVLAHLDAYQWSSYRDYAGSGHSSEVTTTKFFQEKSGEYLKSLKQYLRSLDLADIKPLLLE